MSDLVLSRLYIDGEMEYATSWLWSNRDSLLSNPADSLFVAAYIAQQVYQRFSPKQDSPVYVGSNGETADLMVSELTETCESLGIAVPKQSFPFGGAVLKALIGLIIQKLLEELKQ